jgi:4-hydroxy-2-oxoheptanedioate aldolase
LRENTVKTIWSRGGAVINGWLGIPSSAAAENMAQTGWDSLTVDLQHGLVDYQAAVGMFQAISTTATIPLARVPWNEPGIIMKLLDAGAFGIICPMINTRAEAEALVGACRYAPVGYRSFGPVRAGWVHGADYFKNANATVLAIAMIETQKALDNLDAILSTPGLDGIYVGPADLAISLGRPPQADPTDDTVNKAIDHICAAAKKHGVRPGIHTGSPDGARNMISRGFQFTTILSDNALLANAARAAVAAAKGTAGGASGPKGPY